MAYLNKKINTHLLLADLESIIGVCRLFITESILILLRVLAHDLDSSRFVNKPF